MLRTHRSPKRPQIALWRCAPAVCLCGLILVAGLSARAELPFSFTHVPPREHADSVALWPPEKPEDLPVPQRPPVAPREATSQPADAPPQEPQILGSGYVWFPDHAQPGPTASGGRCWPIGRCLPAGSWTAEADAIFLNRSKGDSQVLIDDGVNNLLNVDNLDFDTEAGPRLSLTCRWDPCTRLEATWIGIADWQSGATVAGALNVTLPTGGTVAAANATLNYASQLNSVEWNLRRQWTNWFEALAGVRWIELDERFAATSTAGALYSVESRNELLGAQLGGRGTVLDHGGRFLADISAKAGVFGNAARGQLSVPAVLANVVDHDSHASILVDIDLRGRWQVHRQAEVHVGYQLLWIDYVMLAAEQFNLGQLRADGQIFMHGPHLGFELRR